MQRRHRLVLILAGIFPALAACGDGASAVLSPAYVRGTYVLEAASGSGATSGVVVLSAGGAAERRIRYSLPGGGESADHVARGTFLFRADGRVDFQLRENNGQSPFVWRPSATLRDRVLRIQYPHPADGPDIVELYRRQ